jgi:predicted anti-sigma-YlaC factor YlaD
VRTPLVLTCADVVKLVSDYLDGQLEPEQRRLFEEHVAICPPCRGYITQLSATKQQLGRLRQDDLPEYVQEDLLRVFRDLELSE